MTLPAVFFGAAIAVLLAGCGDAGDTQAVDTFAAQVEARAGVPFARDSADVSPSVPAKAPSPP